MALTREQLTRPILKVVRVEALDDEVYLRRLTAGDVVNLDADDVGLMLARSLANEDGSRMFADDEKDKALQMRMDVVTELVQAIAAFNGFDTAEQEKNLESAPADDSSSS